MLSALAKPLINRRFHNFIISFDLNIPPLFRHLAPGGQVLVGDVAFATAQEQAACREKAGADWDAEEYYPVAEQLRPLFPDLRFEKISHCAGVFVLGGEQTTAENQK